MDIFLINQFWTHNANERLIDGKLVNDFDNRLFIYKSVYKES